MAGLARSATVTTVSGNSRSVAKAEKQLLPSDEPNLRIRAYAGNALILFNVYGIPLSYGPLLEYYYTNMYPTASVTCLSSILAVQVLLVFSMGTLATWFYKRSSGGLYVYSAASALATTGQFILAFSHQWWHALLAQGVLMGSALGVLRVFGLLYLASHYKNNVPLASTQSGAAAAVGAITYAAVAWQFLRNDKHFPLCLVNAGIIFISLVVPLYLMRKSKRYPLPRVPLKNLRCIFKEPGTIWFLFGYLLVFYSLFVWPTFIVLLLCSWPSSQFPDTGIYALFITCGAAVLTSVYLPRQRVRYRLGPVNTFIMASAIAAMSYVSPAFSPDWRTAWLCSGGYGAALGALLALHVKVTTVFHWGQESYHPDMVSRVNIVSMMAGVAACLGICITGVLVDLSKGFKIALWVQAAVMFGGALLMGIGRWRKCKGVWVAI